MVAKPEAGPRRCIGGGETTWSGTRDVAQESESKNQWRQLAGDLLKISNFGLRFGPILPLRSTRSALCDPFVVGSRSDFRLTHWGKRLLAFRLRWGHLNCPRWNTEIGVLPQV
jgi:hypothetical protein